MPLALSVITTDGEILFLIKNTVLKMEDCKTYYEKFVTAILDIRNLPHQNQFETDKPKKSLAYPVNQIYSFTLGNKHNYIYSLYRDFYVVLLDTIYSNPYNANEYFSACNKLFNDINKSITHAELSNNYSYTYMSLLKILNDPTSYIPNRNIQDINSLILTKDMNYDGTNQLLIVQNDLINPVAPNIDHLDMELMLQMNPSIPSSELNHIKGQSQFIPPLNNSFKPLVVHAKQQIVFESNLFGDEGDHEDGGEFEDGGFGDGGGFGDNDEGGEGFGDGFGDDEDDEKSKKKKSKSKKEKKLPTLKLDIIVSEKASTMFVNNKFDKIITKGKIIFTDGESTDIPKSNPLLLSLTRTDKVDQMEIVGGGIREDPDKKKSKGELNYQIKFKSGTEKEIFFTYLIKDTEDYPAEIKCTRSVKAKLASIQCTIRAMPKLSYPIDSCKLQIPLTDKATKFKFAPKNGTYDEDTNAILWEYTKPIESDTDVTFSCDYPLEEKDQAAVPIDCTVILIHEGHNLVKIGVDVQPAIPDELNVETNIVRTWAVQNVLQADDESEDESHTDKGKGKSKEAEKPKEKEKPKESEKPKEKEKPKETEKSKEKAKESEKPKEKEKTKEAEKPKEKEKPKEAEKPKTKGKK